MTLLDQWFARATSPALQERVSPSSVGLPHAGAPDSDVPPKGSAWFESSHELMRGLLVVEEPPGWQLVPRRSSAAGG